MDLVLAIVLIAAALIIGAAVSGYIFFRKGIEHRKKDAEAQIESAEKEAQRIVTEAHEKAETEKKTKLVEAKDEIYRLRGQAEADAIKAKAIAEAKGIEEKAKAFHSADLTTTPLAQQIGLLKSSYIATVTGLPI